MIILSLKSQDLSAFATIIDLSKVKLNNRGLIVYHVSPTLPEREKTHVSPSRYIVLVLLSYFEMSPLNTLRLLQSMQ